MIKPKAFIPFFYVVYAPSYLVKFPEVIMVSFNGVIILPRQGLTDYEGRDRLQLVSRTNTQFNTALERIDIINQASLMIQKLKPLKKVEFEQLFQ